MFSLIVSTVMMSGYLPSTRIACDLESRGYKVLYKATEEVLGVVKPYSDTGSLPLIRDLQDEGYDVQTVGYGLTDAYHADNGYCLFKDMDGQSMATRFLSIISQLEED